MTSGVCGFRATGGRRGGRGFVDRDVLLYGGGALLTGMCFYMGGGFVDRDVLLYGGGFVDRDVLLYGGGFVDRDVLLYGGGLC